MKEMEALIKIEGKACEKLIDVVSQGIGTLYRPRQIKREADAQAYAIRVIRKAQADADAEARIIEVETEERISRRLAGRETKRQQNIDTVVEMAANNLKGETVSEEPVDVDWATRFFGIVQDVSREEMQLLWAKILAKEVERPSSFSMRTLEVLKNINFAEAAVFERVSNFVLSQNGHFLFNDNSILDRFGIRYVDLALLKECGLLQSGDFVSKNYDSKPEGDMVTGFVYGEFIMLMTIPQRTKTVQIPIALLTQVGQEIFSLLNPVVNMDYMHAIAEGVKKTSPATRVQYAELISREGDSISYKLPLIDL